MNYGYYSEAPLLDLIVLAMRTNRILLVLVLVGLRGIGCSGDNDRSGEDTYTSHSYQESNQAAQDRMHDQYSGALREVTRVWDTNTGQSYDVSHGSDNHYIDNTGSSIISTPGYVENPDPMVYGQMYQGYNYENDGNDR